jgi:probable HAF family extracellular repeat protein
VLRILLEAVSASKKMSAGMIDFRVPSRMNTQKEQRMKNNLTAALAAMTLFAALAAPIQLAAQEQQPSKHHPRYRLVDLGTLGGPQSYQQGFDQNVNNHGTVVAWADTSLPDPFPAACFNPDCFASHGFQWHNGVLTDLGALAPGWSSAAVWISDNGLVDGVSQNGMIDPLTGSPETRAVIWKGGHIVDLGTLGGNESFAIGINNLGQVVGGATNKAPDPFFGTQTRAFRWENGAMQDLGTLGGPDATAYVVNNRGQVIGASFTNSTPNAVTDDCGQNVPTQDPFLWEPPTSDFPTGRMIDLGSLGGTCGFPTLINSRGQVVGQSDVAGDASFHAFFWQSGTLRDLGTFGGNYAAATWLNDAGDVVGWATPPGDQTAQAFLWNNGVMTNLGTLPGYPCSDADAINSRGQVVGGASDCLTSDTRAFLWEQGGPMVDLNRLVAPGSALQLTIAYDINDRGEIAGEGILANGDTHAFLLTPCGDGDAACGDSAVTNQSGPAPGAQPGTAAAPALTGPGMLDRLRARGLPGRRTRGLAGGQRGN